MECEMQEIIDAVDQAGMFIEPEGAVCLASLFQGYGMVAVPERILWDTEDINDGGVLTPLKLATMVRNYATKLIAAADEAIEEAESEVNDARP